jgi:4-hydroxy-3-polyprenylbenzoate decarboxylase
MDIIIALTGASGVVYGTRLLEFIKSNTDHKVYLIISENAKKLIEFETIFKLETVIEQSDIYYENTALDASIASGSTKIGAMIIIPCSMSTAAKINTGIADNLICRTADVCLKEKRKLIIIPRETPVNSTHLKNLLELSEKGVLVLPAMPAFYHIPLSVNHQVDFIVGKVLDNLDIDHQLYKRWRGTN